jgi:serine/threonine-protein kinase RsbT
MTLATVVAREASFSLHSDVDIVAARRGVRDWAKEIHLTVIELTKLVTAASELARNAVLHGGGGTMCLQEVRQGDRLGLRAIFSDNGAGIPDLALAMQDGYTSGTGLGVGLPGARRLVNEFALSTAAEGTSVTIVRWRA